VCLLAYPSFSKLPQSTPLETPQLIANVSSPVYNIFCYRTSFCYQKITDRKGLITYSRSLPLTTEKVKSKAAAAASGLKPPKAAAGCEQESVHGHEDSVPAPAASLRDASWAQHRELLAFSFSLLITSCCFSPAALKLFDIKPGDVFQVGEC